MGTQAKHNPLSREYQGPSNALDARGRVLQEGDEVIVVLKGPTFMRVEAITPVLDPAAPPGALHVTLAAQYRFGVLRGERNTEIIRVQTVGEIGAETQQEPLQ